MTDSALGPIGISIDKICRIWELTDGAFGIASFDTNEWICKHAFNSAQDAYDWAKSNGYTEVIQETEG